VEQLDNKRGRDAKATQHSRACLDGSNQARGQQALKGEGDPGSMQGLHLQPAQQ